MSFRCNLCEKRFKGIVNVFKDVYKECQGRTCPDCGKVRRLGIVKHVDNVPTSFNCSKCGKTTAGVLYDSDKCPWCFLKEEKKEGCICYFEKPPYFCSFCQHHHPGMQMCEECFKLREEIQGKGKLTLTNNNQTFSMINFAFLGIGLIIGLFLGWFFFFYLLKGLKKEKKSL